MIVIRFHYPVESTRDQAQQIRDCLERALDTKLDLCGSISYHRTFEDAPNPVLQLEELGTMGLPLSSPDVTAITSNIKKAAFKRNVRETVDASVCNTWEMDAKSVVLANPAWQTFLKKTVANVCEVLGVDTDARIPRCELYKLSLHGTGSHFSPPVDTDINDGTFATIVFVLPSQFTGGQTHLTYGSISEVYDCSENSLFLSSVMAWYTGVSHETKPITSGYQLALAYNLVHISETPRPAVFANLDFVDAVSAALKQWKEAGSSGPEKIIYLLSQKFRETSLQRSDLGRQDAVRIALLSNIAQESGFQVGIASVICNIIRAAIHSQYSWKEPYLHRRGVSQREKSADLTDSESKMMLSSFIDMDGYLVNRYLEVDEEYEAIPPQLSDVLAKEQAESYEYRRRIEVVVCIEGLHL
ncbi:hypothetical protein ABKN59_001299 [Abortiporus biennis]